MVSSSNIEEVAAAEKKSVKPELVAPDPPTDKGYKSGHHWDEALSMFM